MQKIKKILTQLVLAQRSPKKLAVAFCVGVFIAFSPFIGFHTALMLLIAWMARLNFAMIYASSHLFNNPITVGPLYIADYYVGKKICFFLFGFIPANPFWMQWVNTKISYFIGSGISLWAFIIGGNILGLLVSVALYPFMLWFFNQILAQDTDA
jgi:hypothetical protein